ncbi:Hydra magnipapillata [Nesidiocoris tenuis]|nr:Hydra magnipapillata [Nesidiocoris tenuis]
MRSLQKNRTWKLVDENSVQNQDVLSSRWVFRVKDNGKHKARLVIRGCEQDSSYELEEIFSPVVSANSLRTMFALAAAKNFHIYKFDVKTAFLHGELKGDVFMKMPEGFEVPGKLCKLEKALYGLKCSPMIWNEKFSRTLKMKGFEEVKAERCLFRNVSGSVMVSIYVDDGLVIGKDQDELIQVLASLKEEFDMTIEENPSFFLGMEISRDSSGIKLSQEKYLRSVLQKFRMSDAKPVVTPGYENKIYDRSEEEIKYPYREAVGSLLHLSSRTRPDISNAVNIVSRHIEHPCKEDVEALKRILRYLAGTPSRGIKFSSVGDVQKIDGYSDSDYAGDQDTRRSTSGYIILFAGGPIGWCSRRQPIVALSSTEAEYIAAADCCKEVMYLCSVIEELINAKIQVCLMVDNQSSISLIKTGVVNRRSKHIDVRYHYIFEKFQSGDIDVKYCSTDCQVADMLTKPLGKVKFEKHANFVMST